MKNAVKRPTNRILGRPMGLGQKLSLLDLLVFMGTPELLIQRISIGFLKHDSASVLAFGRQGLIVNRAFQLVVFNSGQKMALRAFYFIRALIKALTYYYTVTT